MTGKVIYQNLTNQKEEKKMVTNFNELTQEEVMSNPSLQKLVYEEIGKTSQYKYHLGNLVGFQNIEDNRSLPGIDCELIVDRAQAAKFGANITSRDGVGYGDARFTRSARSTSP